jgi:hypothetical protein
MLQSWAQFVSSIKTELDLLQLLVLYETGPAAMVARESFQRAFPWLARAPGSPVSMWGFEMMKTPALRARAVRDARMSDIIYVSILGDTALPVGVRQCLEQGLEESPDHPCAVVGVLEATVGRKTQGEVAVVDYLRRVAQRHRARFFCENWATVGGGDPGFRKSAEARK